MTNKERLIAHNNLIDTAITKANNLPDAGSGQRPLVKMKDVNFYDYDGTLLYSYTLAEAQALTELPPLPSQPGLICQGWNYDLETVKTYLEGADVGATYITDDGKTRLYIRIPEDNYLTTLHFKQSISNGVIINWGDDTSTETLSKQGVHLGIEHIYKASGEYIITLEPLEACELTLGSGNLQYSVLDITEGERHTNKIHKNNILYKIEIGKNVSSLYGVCECCSLVTITIPEGVRSGGSFKDCYSLIAVIFPKTFSEGGWFGWEAPFYNCFSLQTVSLTRGILVGDSAFYGCHSLARVVLSKYQEDISLYAFYDCYCLSEIKNLPYSSDIGSFAFSGCRSLLRFNFILPGAPGASGYIGSSAFSSCYNMQLYDFSSFDAVPTLESTDSFSGIPNNCKIKVPAVLYDEWITATNWSSYADHIIPSGIINFTIDGILYQAESGMTWADWINSEYNIDNWEYLINKGSFTDSMFGGFIGRTLNNGSYVGFSGIPTKFIKKNANYQLWED